MPQNLENFVDATLQITAETYASYVAGRAEAANEADGPFSAACGTRNIYRQSRDDGRIRDSPKNLRRDLDLRRAASAAQDHPLARHQLVVDVDRQVGRQREHRDAADHHAGERLRLLGGGERHLRGAEQRAHGVVHVEPRGSLHHARAELPRLLLRGDDDRVARAVERQPVFLAARRRVGEGGIDLHQLVRHTETIEDVDDSLFDHGRIRVMPWPASVKATVAPGASGVSTAELVTKSSPISHAIECSMREPRYAACLTVPRSTPSVGAPPAIRIAS